MSELTDVTVLDLGHYGDFLLAADGFVLLNFITSYPDNIKWIESEKYFWVLQVVTLMKEKVCIIKCVSFNINNIYLYQQLK